SDKRGTETDGYIYETDTLFCQEIGSYCEQKGVTPAVLFEAALLAYLYRINDFSSPVTIGIPVLNRSTLVEKKTIGMFISTMPLSVPIDEGDSAADLCLSIQQKHAEIFRRQKYPLSHILQNIRTKHAGVSGLFDVMISFQNARIEGLDVEVSSTWFSAGHSEIPLGLHIEDIDNTGLYKLHFEYQTAVFSKSEIVMLCDRLLHILRQIIREDSVKIRDIQIVSEAEYQRLIFDFNNTATDFPDDKCINQLFEEQAAKTPNATAVVFSGSKYTYRQIDEMSDSLAGILRDKGITRNDIVAIVSKRSHKAVIAMLAVLKAGGAFLPIDPNSPRERMAFMLKDSACKTVLVSGVRIDDIDVIDLDDDSIFNGGGDKIENINSPQDLCYAIYTSGSTGVPKGVGITHRNFVNFCDPNEKNRMQYMISSKCGAILGTGALFFDMASAEIFMSLLYGFKFVLAGDGQINNAIELARLINDNNVDFMLTTPTKFLSYLGENSFADATGRLKIVSLGGEELSRQALSGIQKCTNATICNGYGPTETTMGCIWGVVDSDITIGSPIANTQIYILDKNLAPLPVGVAGELCIAGEGVGPGYLNRSELTAEKFVQNPFGSGKMYKSGDLAKWREDGKVYFVGRMDFQVKIRGLRIELGEIESAIAAYCGVTQTAVTVHNSNGRQYLCAYYTGDEVDTNKIKDSLAKKLPQYMIPHFFTRLDVFPQTPGGKTDRKALPAPDFTNKQTKTAYIAPVTEKEKILAETIALTLNTPNVSMMDCFLDLGGDSLKAIELAAKLENRGYAVQVREILSLNTVASIAGTLTECTKKENIRAVFEGDIPATSAQERIYLAQSMAADTVTYNVPVKLKFKKAPDAEKLEGAFKRLIERHEILRTHFENKDGKIVQVVNETVQFGFDTAENFIRPFDLSKAPLMRAAFDGNTLALDMHHCITDGGSMPVLFDELSRLYCGEILKEPAVQYVDFTSDSISYRTGEKYKRDEAHWLNVFKGSLPVLSLSTDKPRPKILSFNGRNIS
ncbi:MAG: amino acid adenylation domain-containing protein, partial [Oscillospiraceae bacterium]|nr:amino acid adenylation domain-containing protein [Oscillospiraceae bacterium]